MNPKEKFDYVWPKMCSRCGSQEEESLIGDHVRIVRIKTESYGIIQRKYRTYDMFMQGYLYLCPECERIAQDEMKRLLPRRNIASTAVGIIALVLGLLSFPILSIFNSILNNFFLSVIVTIISPSVLLAFFFSTRISEHQFNMSGTRRFYFDWTIGGPIRLTNPTLLDEFSSLNPDARVKLVDSISKNIFEKPSLGDLEVGFIFGVILFFTGLYTWSILMNIL